MRKILQLAATIISLSTIMGVANAATPGSYLGLGLGGSVLETPSQMFDNSAPNSASRTKGGFGGRAFAGYNLNEYFGLEGGYGYYTPSKYKGSSSASQSPASTLNYSMSDFDLVGKVYVPLVDNSFNLYALGGAAYVLSKTDYTNNYATLAPGVVAPENGSTTTKKLLPKYGVGVNYTIPDTNVIAGLEYSRIQGSGNVKTSNSAIPSADLATFTLAYNFN